MIHPAFCSPLFQHSRRLWGFFWSTLWMEASTRVRVQGPSWTGRAGAPAVRGACKVGAHRRWGSRSCQRAGAGAGGGSLLLPRDVIHLTFVRSNFRSSSIALVLHRQVVPEFIIDMLLDSNVASTFGDDRGPRGRRGGAPGLLLPCGRWACPSSLPSVALLNRPLRLLLPGPRLCSRVDRGSAGHLQFRPGSALPPPPLV